MLLITIEIDQINRIKIDNNRVPIPSKIRTSAPNLPQSAGGAPGFFVLHQFTYTHTSFFLLSISQFARPLIGPISSPATFLFAYSSNSRGTRQSSAASSSSSSPFT